MSRRNKLNKKNAPNNKANPKEKLAFRMTILFVSIFALFSILILRLGYLQIVKGDDYNRALRKTEEVNVNMSVPRGRIYDRQGQILVDNKPKNAITYTKLQSTTSDEMLRTAKKLTKYIKMDTSKLTKQDKQDFWIMLHKKEAYKKISKSEQNKFNNDEKLTDKEKQSEIDKLVRSRITKVEIKSLSKIDLQVLAIYSKMVAGYNLSPQIIKNENVSDKEFAVVSEHLNELPNVNTTTDWERVKYSDLSILGSTTTPFEGIPKDKLDYYLARDYARNDRVGKSYIEEEYEELLQGEKAVIKSETNSTGQVVDTTIVSEGLPGNDLVLTIDSELQEKLEEVVEKQLLTAKYQGGSSLLDRAFLVMMNPNTGEVLSMVGKKLDIDEQNRITINDYAIGTFTSSYEVGSVVKPATILTGYALNAIRPYQVLVDTPINIAGTIKKSIFNTSGVIYLDDLAALERSSNVYMFQTAFRIAGVNYVPGAGLSIDANNFTKVRNSFAQFGLGVETGIDLPGEATGVKGPESISGKFLDLVIGQYDTFTPLQLAQYVSTIANGGKRIQPHLLKEIRKPSEDGKLLGSIIDEVSPKVLNTINNTPEEINHVKKGMHRVYYGNRGSAYSDFKDSNFDAAGKTGTAEVVYYGPKKEAYGTNTLSVTHIGFAPYNNPEIAYAVVVPWMTTSSKISNYINNKIARQAIEQYYALQKKKSNKQTVNHQILKSKSDEDKR